MSFVPLQRWPARRVYFIREAWAALNSGLIVSSVWALYYETMRLSLSQIALLYAVITIAGMLLEVPTGILADSSSRRLSIILGGGCIGLAYMSLGIAPMFAVALFVAFLESIGDACISGALEAWITDEVGATHVGPVFVRAAQMSAPMHWLGVALSVVLAAWFNYQIPIIIGGLLWLGLTLLLLLVMPETAFRATPGAEQAGLHIHLQDALTTFSSSVRMIRQHTLLWKLMIASFCISGLIEFFWWMAGQHVLLGFQLPLLTLPLIGVLKGNAWLGLLNILRSVCALLSMTVLHATTPLRRSTALAGILTLLTITMLPGMLLFASTGSLALAIAAWLLVNVCYDSAQPIRSTWLNQIIDSEQRATVLSIHSQVVMLGMLLLASALSAASDCFGMRPTLLLGSVLLIPAALLYLQGWRMAVPGVHKHSQDGG